MITGKTKDPKNNLIVSVGVGTWHPKGIDRLLNSLFETGYSGDFIFHTDEYPQNCPTHQENPYAFKAYAFQNGLNHGYRKILWVDASFWAVKNPDVIFDRLDNEKYLFCDSGWATGQWCSDYVMNNLWKNRDDLMKYPMLSAGCMAFDFNRPVCKEFFNLYKLYCDKGYFKGSWTNKNKEVSNDERVLGHRHDQTIASIVSWDLGMRNWKTTDSPFQYNPKDGKVKDSTIFLAEGM